MIHWLTILALTLGTLTPMLTAAETTWLDDESGGAIPPHSYISHHLEVPWGKEETASLHHWCRSHSELKSQDQPVHVNDDHQHMRLETRVFGVANNDYTKEKITKVVIELGHSGDGNPVKTWTWTPGKADEIEFTGVNTFTVLYDKSHKTRDAGANQGRGRYSATTTVTVELIKKKNDPKVADTQTLIATTTFNVIEFGIAMGNSRDAKDDVVQIRDLIGYKDGPAGGKVPTGGQNFYEPVAVWLLSPGNPGAVAIEVASVANRAPIVDGAANELGAAPTTVQKKRFSVPGAGHGDRTDGTGMPPASASVSFLVTGRAQSAAYQDETYHVTMVDDPCSNAPAQAHKSTVFYFTDAALSVVVGPVQTLRRPTGPQSILSVQPGSVDGRFFGRASVAPAQVAQDNPRQVQDIRIGFTQNTRSMNLRRANYLVRLNTFVARPGATGTASIRPNIQWDLDRPTPLQDTNAAADPLYSRSAAALLPVFNAPGGGNQSTSSDSPRTPVDNRIAGEVSNTSGAIVGTVVYDLDPNSVSHGIGFDLWLVGFSQSKNRIVPIRQLNWAISASSANPVPAVAGADSPASAAPIVGPTFSNNAGSERFVPGGTPILRPLP